MAYRAVFFGVLALSGVPVGCGDSDPAVTGPAVGSPDGGRDVGARPRPGDPCLSRLDCDDGVFCNGDEECLGGVCTGPRNVACRGTSCTTSRCDEASGGCSVTQTQSCGEACASDGDCDDGRSCTRDLCDATFGCLHLPDDARCPTKGACGVGVCLTDGVADADGCGARPDSAKCALTEGCEPSETGELACVSLRATCARDADCSDHSLCDGVERCVLSSAGEGRCVHGTRTTCSAGDSCHHTTCVLRDLGDPYCLDVKLPRCP